MRMPFRKTIKMQFFSLNKREGSKCFYFDVNSLYVENFTFEQLGSINH
jgi:hypothetical protein